MARFKTIAGFFDMVTERQTVTVMQTEHVKDDSGQLMFEDDGIKPVMRDILVETFVDVPVRRWIDQVNIPFTPEEEAERDLEEAQYEIEKTRVAAEAFAAEKKTAIDKLTLVMSEQLLMTENEDKAIKASYRAAKERISQASTSDELKQITS